MSTISPNRLHLPLAVKAGEAGLAGEELLHGGLFEVALLGDEPVQRSQQRIHIAQRLRDGALFGEGRNCNWTSEIGPRLISNIGNRSRERMKLCLNLKAAELRVACA